MPKKAAPPAPYPQGFQLRLIEVVRAEQPPEALSRKLSPTAESIRNRVLQGHLDEGKRRDGRTTAERE